LAEYFVPGDMPILLQYFFSRADGTANAVYIVCGVIAFPWRCRLPASGWSKKVIKKIG
jgi:hypothetical protein